MELFFDFSHPQSRMINQKAVSGSPKIVYLTLCLQPPFKHLIFSFSMLCWTSHTVCRAAKTRRSQKAEPIPVLKRCQLLSGIVYALVVMPPRGVFQNSIFRIYFLGDFAHF